MVLLLGILLAVALMASGVVFSDFLAEAALRRSLNDTTPQEANISVRVFNGLDDPSTVPEESSKYQTSLDFVNRRAYQRFQPYLRDQARFLETATFFFEGHPQLELADDVRPRGKIKYMTGLFTASRLPEAAEGRGARTEIIRGNWPYTANPESTEGGPSGQRPEASRRCSCASGIMVLKHETHPRKGAPNRCYHATTPTASVSPSTITAWWPMAG